MYKLSRPISPSCLRKFSYQRHQWKDVTSDDKGEIWLKLDEMQGKRCAYCEAAIVTSREGSTAHIEHFEQRRLTVAPQKTFLWSNLFGSCNRQDSCGKHKDDQQYRPQDLLKPDIEDPEQFLIFVADGTVQPKAGLSQADKQRATETIRVFNLNGSLTAIREREVQGYIQTTESLLEFLEFEDGLEVYEAELQKELDAVFGYPFETAIRHTLCQQS